MEEEKNIDNKKTTSNIIQNQKGQIFVMPKQNCPHIFDSVQSDSSQINYGTSCSQDNCNQSENQQLENENWICLYCLTTGCSRYVNSHALKHFQNNKVHCIAVSQADLSIWCYKCENYITHAKLEDYLIKIEFQKFSSELKNPRDKILKNLNNFKTGLFYEENYESKMNLHFCTNNPNFENPERTQAAVQYLMERQIPALCRPVIHQKCSKDELLLVHTDEYIEKIKNMEFNQKDLFLNPDSYEAACAGVGGVIELTKMVVQNKIDNGFALVRPAGHHVKKYETGGFCIFNNIAIGVQYALQVLKQKKILIIDWDFHHGNGIQEIFYNNSQVVYISIHSFEFQKDTIFSEEGLPNKIGNNQAQGTNINISLVYQPNGYDDIDYITIFDYIINPVVKEFQPDLVFVASGFDASKNEPIWNYNISSECFGKMTQRLVQDLKQKVIMSLEGGYKQENINRGCENCIKALLGENINLDCTQQQIKQETLISLKYVYQYQHKYWKFMKNWENIKINNQLISSFPNNNVIDHYIQLESQQENQQIQNQ